MSFSGQRVFITGGFGGIGFACAERFANDGAKVFLLDRHVDEDKADQLGAVALAIELGDDSAWQALLKHPALTEVFDHGLDVLVNSAGISGLKDIEQADYAWWRSFQEANSDSVFLAIHHLMPALKAAPSASIVNIGSTLALQPSPDLPAYTASKGAVRNLTKSVALHCAREGYKIRCNSVHPGSTVTPMMAANLGSTEEEREANLSRRMSVHPYSNSVHRLATPEDIANSVCFLASDQASFITGADLPVDGGATI